jgi:hypothetical protein
MRTPSSGPRGTTLVETMAAFAIVMFGAAGMTALQRSSNVLMADARRSTRATAYALDLVNQIQLWDYATETAEGGRLANTTTVNDTDLGDSNARFMIDPDPVTAEIADHAEDDLGDGNALDAGSLGDNHMERYWNVAPLPDSNTNGVADGVLVSVIVRWEHDSHWRRVVLMTARKNPADF